MSLRELFADVIEAPPPPQPGKTTPEESRRERMAREAAEKLRQHPECQRAATLEPDDPHGTTCTAAVAVRLGDGAIATAVLTGIRAPDDPPLSLLAALERACSGPLQ